MRPLMLIALLCGCATSHLEQPGTWRPIGANDINLRAMVSDPAHLRAGVAASTERGAPAALAIRLLNTNRRRPLPDTRAAQIGAVAGGVPTAAAPAAGVGSNAP